VVVAVRIKALAPEVFVQDQVCPLQRAQHTRLQLALVVLVF
jgi:hypothetical protein